MVEKTDVSKWVTYPARIAVGTVAGAGLFLLGRSFEVPGSAEFWDLAAQPLATTVAGAGAIAAGLLALHNGAKSRALDGIHHQQTMDRDREMNLRDRYTTAAQQLGDENSAIREAGVHAVAALVDDWFSHGELTQQREHSHSQARVCAHLLCSYLRANRHVEPGSTEFRADEVAVRSSVVGVFRERIPKWRGIEDEWKAQEVIAERGGILIDLSGAILPNSNLAGVDLRHAILVGTNLMDSNLEGARLDGANLTGANLRLVNLVFTNMSGADVSGADLSAVTALRTVLSGVRAQNAIFDQAVIMRADFADADLRGASFIGVEPFSDDTFSHDTLFSEETKWPDGFIPSRGIQMQGSRWVRR